MRERERQRERDRWREREREMQRDIDTERETERQRERERDRERGNTCDLLFSLFICIAHHDIIHRTSKSKLHTCHESKLK